MLDIHPADDAERIALYRNVYDVWGRGLPIEEHVQRRLASPQHNRARWFVGCTGGRVATSLGIYPLEFRCRGDVVPGIAIGAVHTHADFRGQGFAPELIRWVEDYYRREHGAAIGLLYSDIKPAYYARLGYVECPAWELDFAMDSIGDTTDESNRFELHAVPLSPAVPLMSDLYDAFHRDLPVSIHRSPDYWNYLHEKSPHDEVYVMGSTAEPDGYLRTGRWESSLIVRDFATRGPADASRLVNAVRRIAGQSGAAHVTGWVPHLAEPFASLAVRRAAEITMLKPLLPESPLDETVKAAADWFHEIDHV